jgi:hypothetical protein
MNRLHISEITSIGAVESGDNDLDDQSILLFKSKSIEPAPGLVEKEGSMPFDIDTLTDEAKTYVSDLEAKLAALSEEPAALPDDMPDVVKAKFDENDATIAKMQSDNERVSKENAALRDEMATTKWTVRATELAPVLGADEGVPEILKDLDAAAPEPFGKLNAMFDTAVSVVTNSPLFKELGDSASDGSAEDQITAFAAEIRKNQPEMSMVKARAEAWTQHPDLKTLSREEA